MSKNDATGTPSIDLWFDSRISELRKTATGLRDKANDADRSADLLESELKAYRAANPHEERSPARHNGADHTVDVMVERRKAGRQIMPGSKSDQIINLVKEAGTRGLKVGEILSTANERGLDIKSNSLRGLVWAQKKAGRFVAADDRYYTPENAPR